MRKFTLHARIEITLAIALLLGSCTDSGGNIHTVAEAYDLADVARANSVNALYEVEELKSRVSELERRVGLH